MGYRTLVSKAEVPEWTSRSIKGIAFHRDLYATPGGPELDEFERWVATEFEEPALEALERAISDRPLTADDLKCLGGFFAAQDVRTPASFLESQERWHTQIPETLQRTVDAAIKKIEQAKKRGVPVEVLPPRSNPFGDAFRISIEPHDEGRSAIRVKVASGRALWIASMRLLLTGKPLAALREHKWSIVEPDGNDEWFTSDHPAMRLNFNSVADYNFGGGWGRKKCDLLLPLSPRHLLYAQVGVRHPDRFKFRPDQTRLIQRLLAERASRWIFARAPLAIVSQDRPRIVDADRVKAEEQFWANWDGANRKAEAE